MITAAWKESWVRLSRNWHALITPVLMFLLLFMAVSAYLIFPLDGPLVKLIAADKESTAWLVAKAIGKYADFMPLMVLTFSYLLWRGYRRKSKSLLVIAFSFLIASGLAGLVAQTTKSLVGRPRPSQYLENGVDPLAFRGPTVEGGWRGYPSGHSAAIWGGVMFLAVVYPRTRKWVLTLAVIVALSRVVSRYHFVSDVVHGSALGAAWGWLVAQGLRERAQEAERKVASIG